MVSISASECNSSCQTADGRGIAASASVDSAGILGEPHAQRFQHAYRFRGAEIAREHRDDGGGAAIERDTPPDHILAAGKVRLPEWVCKHDRGRGAGLVLGGIEVASEEWMHADQRQEVGGNGLPADGLGLSNARKIVSDAGHHSHAGKDVVLRPPI